MIGNEMKTCSKCGESKPATKEYFYKHKRRKDGLECWCKECVRANSRKWREKNTEKARESVREWAKINPERYREYSRKWYENNPEKERERSRKWCENNPEKRRMNKANRRARKAGLPATLTTKQKRFARKYFGNCCAICGRSACGDRVIALDHWIPLSDPRCPGTVAENMIPLCHGLDGCNNKKSNLDPIEWLERKFGTQAGDILERIETYFISLQGDF